MLAMAARRCDGHPNVTLHEAEATRLLVEDAGFDAAFSVQVLGCSPKLVPVTRIRRCATVGTADPPRSNCALRATDAIRATTVPVVLVNDGHSRYLMRCAPHR